MLHHSEKAYCLALQALKEKKYQQAAGYFDQAAEFFVNNIEFKLLHQTTRLLVALKTELGSAKVSEDDTLIIEEVYSNGQKTDVP